MKQPDPNGVITKDKIAKAVRIAEAKKNTEFEAWKERTVEVIRETDQKLVAAEEKAKAAEKHSTSKEVEVEVGIDEVLEARDEAIRELSRAKLSLQEENAAKDGGISAKMPN